MTFFQYFLEVFSTPVAYVITFLAVCDIADSLRHSRGIDFSNIRPVSVGGLVVAIIFIIMNH